MWWYYLLVVVAVLVTRRVLAVLSEHRRRDDVETDQAVAYFRAVKRDLGPHLGHLADPAPAPSTPLLSVPPAASTVRGRA